MSLLAQFLPANEVAQLSDQQVEILADQLHAQLLTTALNNEQVKTQLSGQLTGTLTRLNA